MCRNDWKVFKAYLRPVKDILHRQHRHDCEHLFAAAQMDGHDQHLTQHGLQRELSHLADTNAQEIKSLIRITERQEVKENTAT